MPLLCRPCTSHNPPALSVVQASNQGSLPPRTSRAQPGTPQVGSSVPAEDSPEPPSDDSGEPQQIDFAHQSEPQRLLLPLQCCLGRCKSPVIVPQVKPSLAHHTAHLALRGTHIHRNATGNVLTPNIAFAFPDIQEEEEDTTEEEETDDDEDVEPESDEEELADDHQLDREAVRPTRRPSPRVSMPYRGCRGMSLR